MPKQTQALFSFKVSLMRKKSRPTYTGMLSNKQLKELLEKTNNFTKETEDDGLKKDGNSLGPSEENQG